MRLIIAALPADLQSSVRGLGPARSTEVKEGASGFHMKISGSSEKTTERFAHELLEAELDGALFVCSCEGGGREFLLMAVGQQGAVDGLVA